MLLRELIIDEHTLSLNENGNVYVAVVKNSKGEKLFYHEYQDYEKIKEFLDIIVEEYEGNRINIKRVLGILESSK